MNRKEGLHVYTCKIIGIHVYIHAYIYVYKMCIDVYVHAALHT